MIRYDVVVVGGGIAGSALATVLARDGLRVLVLERQAEFRDRVRGETLVCWGVAELLRMKLDRPLLAAGGGYATRFVGYDEIVDPAEAAAAAVPLDQLLPGVPGCLDVGHPQACEALLAAAATSGATVRRGVGELEIGAGESPTARYRDGEDVVEVSCRLIVGADGRHSTVRRQLGIELTQTTARARGGGMLVDDLHAWPADQTSLGTESDLHFLISPRPGGRVRLYLLHDAAQKGRFSGPNGPREFLAAYRFRCIPGSEMFAAARPAGPCVFYPMNDGWAERPHAPGAVLIGDAAGWNDPILGQGLAIALRDARTVADVLRTGADPGPDAWAGYTGERRERMRRLRVLSQVATELRATFTPRGVDRRRAFTEAAATDPLLAGLRLTGLIGPENVPAEAFGEANVARIHALDRSPILFRRRVPARHRADPGHVPRRRGPTTAGNRSPSDDRERAGEAAGRAATWPRRRSPGTTSHRRPDGQRRSRRTLRRCRGPWHRSDPLSCCDIGSLAALAHGSASSASARATSSGA